MSSCTRSGSRVGENVTASASSAAVECTMGETELCVENTFAGGDDAVDRYAMLECVACVGWVATAVVVAPSVGAARDEAVTAAASDMGSSAGDGARPSECKRRNDDGELSATGDETDTATEPRAPPPPPPRRVVAPDPDPGWPAIIDDRVCVGGETPDRFVVEEPTPKWSRR